MSYTSLPVFMEEYNREICNKSNQIFHTYVDDNTV